MIPVSEEVALLLTECRHELTNILQSKFGCTFVCHNVENGSPSKSRGAEMRPDVRFRVKLPKGLKISVWKDDLTTHRVDAVVNAANGDLIHGAGLASALSKAGGKEIEEECKRIIRKISRLPTGKAVVTTAGLLPCKKVIHAVGPELPEGASHKNVEEAGVLLREAILNILAKVEQERLQSVAIPAISSGLFHFPLKRCADIIVQTLKEYHDKKHRATQDLEIRLVNNDEPTVHQMERACREILGSDALYSREWKRQRKSLAKSPVLVRNARLHIKKGCIEEEEVDVIVNTVGQEVNLSTGEISRALLKKAGTKMQYEIQPRFYNFGEVITTDGYKLNCTHVYHAVCAQRSEKFSKQILKDVVEECLKKAASAGMKSISFPAIGTGHLNFQKNEVASIMVGAAADLARKTGVYMDIFFVLFPSDLNTFKAFEREICSLEDFAGTSSTLMNASKEVAGAMGEAEQTPCIEVCCDSSEQKREATNWIVKLLYHTPESHRVLNNHILHFGLKEYNDLLSIETKRSVAIEEFLQDGLVGVTIKGTPKGVKGATLAVEALCCQAQEEFAQAEEDDLLSTLVRWQCEEIPELNKPGNSVALERAYLAGCDTRSFTVDGRGIEVSFKRMEATDLSGKCYAIERKSLLDEDAADVKKISKCFYQRKLVEQGNHVSKDKLFAGLEVIKIEKVENSLLEHHFQLKKQQLGGNTMLMYKQVSAQFCDLVCRVGFQKTYSPPRHQKFGAGIYFYSNPEALRKQDVGADMEEYVYIFLVQVLRGKFCKGSPELILPPALREDPLIGYNSVTGDTDTHVIFNSRQALPEYLITCRKAPASHTL